MLIVVKYGGFAAHEILQNESFNYHNLKTCSLQKCVQIDSISYFVFFLLICMSPGNTKHLLGSRFSALDQTLGQAPSLTHKHQARLKRLTRDKHSSLLWKSVNYSCNKFYDTGPGNTEHLLGSRLSALDLFMLNQNALLTCQQNCLA